MKKILLSFILLISFNSFLFAKTCEGNFLSRTSNQGSNCGSEKVHPNYGTWVNYPQTWSCIFVKSVSGISVSNTVECPNSIPHGKENEELALLTPDGTKCVLKDGVVLCDSIPENGFLDDDLKPGCNSGYSLTGIGISLPACMPNPPNGTYDDNDDLVCNAGFYNNGGTCSPSNVGNIEHPDPNVNVDET